MTRLSQVLALAESHSTLAVAAAVVVLVAVVLLARAIRDQFSKHQAEDVLTLVAASVATTVVMNGMWRFAGNVLHFSGAERVTMFAFLELAMLTEAFRARRNIRESAARAAQAREAGARPEPVTAGVDGAAVWALSALSAVLSALDASSAAEAVARLASPLVAAWLWERGLSLYRRRLTGGGVHWVFTVERVLVRLGLAEPSGRAVSEIAAHRRLTLLARAAKRARALKASEAAGWRQRRAGRRLDAAMERAVEHAGLASDPGRQDALMAQMGALYAAAGLADLRPAAPWDRREKDAQAAAEAARQVQAADQARELAVAAANQATEAAAARARAATMDAAQARADLERLRAASITTAVQALGQAHTALHTRAETAERELAEARTRAGELAEALARAEQRTRTGADQTARGTRTARPHDADVDRDALVAELAAEILLSAEAGEKWHPDYDALMERTDRSRRWCEYVVRDARNAAVCRTDDTSEPAPASPPQPASAEPARAGVRATANGSADLAGVAS
jgi:hypothetical protein